MAAASQSERSRSPETRKELPAPRAAIAVEECGGRVDILELTHKEESFPRCWNRTNAKDLIHCRYNTW